MKVRLGRRVFDAGELPIIATAGVPDPENVPDAVERAVAAGADAVEIVEAEGHPIPGIARLVATIRSHFPYVVVGVRASGPRTAEAAVIAGADLLAASPGGARPWLAEIAAATGTSITVTSSESAEHAVTVGMRRDAVLVEAGDASEHLRSPANVLSDLVQVGWPVLVTLPDTRPLAEALTVAAICAWLGVRVFRTDRVPQTRQALDMAATLRGTREPAVGRRGLG